MLLPVLLPVVLGGGDGLPGDVLLFVLVPAAGHGTLAVQHSPSLWLSSSSLGPLPRTLGGSLAVQLSP